MGESTNFRIHIHFNAHCTCTHDVHSTHIFEFVKTFSLQCSLLTFAYFATAIKLITILCLVCLYGALLTHWRNGIAIIQESSVVSRFVSPPPHWVDCNQWFALKRCVNNCFINWSANADGIKDTTLSALGYWYTTFDLNVIMITDCKMCQSPIKTALKNFNNEYYDCLSNDVSVYSSW